MNLHQSQRKKVTMNLTSLIDVLFILIIFFTVSSTFLEQPGIELDLPEAESSESHTAQKVILYIDSENNLYLNDEQIQKENVAKEVKQLIEAQTDKSVVLRADEKVQHGTVIRLMDELRKDGIYKIVVSTVKPMKN